MSLPLDRFKKIIPEHSILSDSTGIKRDKQKPYTLTEWITNSGLDQGSPEVYIGSYNKYLNEWTSKTNELDVKNDVVLKMYENIVKQIGLDYSTSEEQRFLSNLDYDKPNDIDAAIPFYAERLKDIVLYISKQRNISKSQKTKYTQYGTNRGVQNLIRNQILNYSATPSLSVDIVDVDNSLNITVDELYDTYDSYFDQDTCKTPDELNHVEYDPYLFIDFETAIKNVASDVAGIIMSDTNGLVISNESGLLLTIVQETTDIDYNDFPPREFFNFVNAEENLNLHNQKKFVSSFIGSKMISLSANTKGDYLTADHVEPTDPLYNFYNHRHPTVNYSAKTSHLYTARQLGGYFTPNNLSTLNYISIEPQVKIDKTKLTAGVFELIDPKIYGSESFVVHTENVEWLKADNSNSSLAGSIVNDTHLAKFYGYQSKVESNKFSQFGISRVEDNFDFWSGQKSDVWANSDVYKLQEQNNFDLETRQEDLLLSHYYDDNSIFYRGHIAKWNNDIFGNNISVFKRTKPAKLASTAVFSEDGSVESNIQCEHIHGGTFEDETDDYLLSIDGGTFESPGTSIINGYLFVPDLCADLHAEIESEPINLNLSIPFYETSIRAPYTTSLILSGGTVTVPSNLDSRLSIYDQRYITPGEAHIRNINHTIIDPLTTGLSVNFEKYPTNITAELGNLIDIDVIYDILILQTESYKVFDKISYNYNTNKFEKTDKLYTISANSAEEFTTHFFNENSNEIVFGRVTMEPLTGSNHIVPQLYRYDISTGNVNMMYDGTESDIDQFDVGLSATFGKPHITYNDILDKYYVVFSMTQLDATSANESFVKYSFNNDRKKFKLDSAEQFNSGFSNVNGIEPNTNETVELNSLRQTSNTTTLTAANTIDFTLNVDPTSLSETGNYPIIKLIYDWGDGETEVEDLKLKVPTVITSIENNPKSPLNTLKTHEYTLSAHGHSLLVTVTAFDYEMNEEVFTIDIESQVGAIKDILGNLNLIECKSFINNNTEYTLLVVEPDYGDVFQIMLKGKTYE